MSEENWVLIWDYTHSLDWLIILAPWGMVLVAFILIWLFRRGLADWIGDIYWWMGGPIAKWYVRIFGYTFIGVSFLVGAPAAIFFTIDHWQFRRSVERGDVERIIGQITDRISLETSGEAFSIDGHRFEYRYKERTGGFRGPLRQYVRLAADHTFRITHQDGLIVRIEQLDTSETTSLH